MILPIKALKIVQKAKALRKKMKKIMPMIKIIRRSQMLIRIHEIIGKIIKKINFLRVIFQE
jgi:hypothetical protein